MRMMKGSVFGHVRKRHFPQYVISLVVNYINLNGTKAGMIDMQIPCIDPLLAIIPIICLS